MCGRFQITVPWSVLVSMYGIRDDAGPPGDAPFLRPRHNVCPTDNVAVVRLEAGRRVLEVVRWGFPMTWLARQGKDPFSRSLINAKSEEAAEKQTWRKAVRERRCIVPTTGFVEWLRDGKARWPLRFYAPDAEVLTLAGIWGDFERDGRTVRCVSLLTTAGAGVVPSVHDRMPVVLDAPDWDAWMDPAAPFDAVQALMRPHAGLVAAPLNTAINKVKASGPELMAPDWAWEGPP